MSDSDFESDDDGLSTSDFQSDLSDEEDEIDDNVKSDSGSGGVTTPSVLSTTSIPSEKSFVIEDKEVEEIFPKGIFNRNLFTVNDDEESHFSVENYINDLTRRLMSKIRKQEFIDGDVVRRNLTPEEKFKMTTRNMTIFNKVFSLAVGTVDRLRKLNYHDSKKNKEENVKSVSKYMKELNDSNVNLDVVSERSKRLEESLSEIGNSIIQTGNVLTQLNNYKERASKIKKLLDYFNEFNSYKMEEFVEVMKKRKFKYRVFNERKRELAAVRTIQEIKSLILTELSQLPNCEQGKKNVARYEKELMGVLRRRFSRALNKDDAMLIKRRALVLFEVGAMNTCENLFVLKIYNEFIKLPKNFKFPEDLDEDEDDDDEVDAVDISSISDGYEKDIIAMREGVDSEELRRIEKQRKRKRKKKEARKRKKKKKRKKRKGRIVSSDEDEDEDYLSSDDEEFEGEEDEDEDSLTSEEESGEEENLKKKKRRKKREKERSDEKEDKLLKKEIRKEARQRKKEEEREDRQRLILEQTKKLNKMIRNREDKLINQNSRVEKFSKLLMRTEEICLEQKDLVATVFGEKKMQDIFVSVFNTIIQKILQFCVENIFDEERRSEEIGGGNYVSPETPVPTDRGSKKKNKIFDKFVSHMGGSKDLFSIDEERKLIKQEEKYLQDFFTMYQICLLFVKSVSIDNEESLMIEGDKLMPLFENLFHEQKEYYIEKEIDILKRISNIQIRAATKIISLSEESKKKGKSSKMDVKNKSLQKVMNQKRTTRSPLKQMKNIVGGDKIALISFDFEKILRVLHANADALKRCVILASPETIHENVIEIFKILVDFGHNYLVYGLDCSIREFVKKFGAYTEPPTRKLFADINICVTMMQKFQQHMVSKVIPKLKGNYLLQNKCWKLRHELFGALEDRIGKALRKMFARIVEYAGSLLKNNYDKKCYRGGGGGGDDMFMTIVNCSDYVQKTLEFLKTQHGHINRTLYHANKDVFLGKLGLTFHDTLLNFMVSKVKVSLNLHSSMKFKKDIGEFQKFFEDFKCTMLDKKFDQLRSLCGVVSVMKENVYDVCITMGTEELIEKDVIVQFVKMREDFKNIKFPSNNSFGL